MIRRLLLALALTLAPSLALAQVAQPLLWKPGGAPPAYVGLGDLGLTGQQNYWGTRAYSAATAGTKSVNICNSGGGCFDINTLSNGNFDYTTYAADCTTCSVDIVYDKVRTNNFICGSGAYSASCPTIINASGGAQYCLSMLNVPGSTTFKTASPVGLTTQPFSLISESAMSTSGTSYTLTLYWGSFSGDLQTFEGNGQVQAAGLGIVTTSTSGTFISLQTIWHGASSLLNVNGSPTAGSTTSVFNSSDGLASYTSGTPLASLWCELDVVTTDVTSSLSSIYANQHGYW